MDYVNRLLQQHGVSVLQVSGANSHFLLGQMVNSCCTDIAAVGTLEDALTRYSANLASLFSDRTHQLLRQALQYSMGQ